MDHSHHHSMVKHLAWMAGAAGIVLLLFVFSGFNLAAALPIAIALACPLGMIGMMLFMGHGMRGGHTDHTDQDHQHHQNLQNHESVPLEVTAKKAYTADDDSNKADLNNVHLNSADLNSADLNREASR